MNISTSMAVFTAVIGLIGIGLYCLLITRNLIRVVVALQILVKGAMLALVFVGQMQGQPSLGQSMALTVIVADTIVAVVGLALAVQVKRYVGSLDIAEISKLKR
ncbi:MAG: NADH-quinone oxidoreductase subunit K [Anaerolineaceae bacterium]|jgi:NADH:ubiquinone oxidoreductase subunit K|nr:NADH-quinone oxidoreductase subunit K [Anaerolineaceae bacterium]